MSATLIYSIASNEYVQAAAFLLTFFAVYWVVFVPKGASVPAERDF